MPHDGVDAFQTGPMGHPMHVDHTMIDFLLESAESLGRGVVAMEALEARRVEEPDALISRVTPVCRVGENVVGSREWFTAGLGVNAPELVDVLQLLRLDLLGHHASRRSTRTW